MKRISFQIPLHNTIAVQGTEFEEILQEVREYFLTLLCPGKIDIPTSSQNQKITGTIVNISEKLS